MVVILVLAADIEQAVDRTRSAQHFAARLDDPPVVQLGFRLGLVQPVDLGIVEQFAVAEWNMNPDMPIVAAGFEQEHAVAAGFSQAVGEHAASRPGADDDVVEPRFVRNRRHGLLTPFSSPGLLSMMIAHSVHPELRAKRASKGDASSALADVLRGARVARTSGRRHTITMRSLA